VNGRVKGNNSISANCLGLHTTPHRLFARVRAMGARVRAMGANCPSPNSES